MLPSNSSACGVRVDASAHSGLSHFSASQQDRLALRSPQLHYFWMDAVPLTCWLCRAASSTGHGGGQAWCRCGAAALPAWHLRPNPTPPHSGSLLDGLAQGHHSLSMLPMCLSVHEGRVRACTCMHAATPASTRPAPRAPAYACGTALVGQQALPLSNSE